MPITGPDLTDFIPKPATGATPTASFFEGDYGGTVEWYFIEESTLKKMEDATFRPETVYTARVTLIPIVGCFFPDGPIAVTYGGGDVVVGENGNGTFTGDSVTRTGTITFPETPEGQVLSPLI